MAPRRAALILAHTKLVLIAKACGKIRDIQRAQSSSWIVAVASGVEPVVAMFDRVQRRVRAGVGLTGLCQLIDHRVKKIESCVRWAKGHHLRDRGSRAGQLGRAAVL